MPVSRVTQPRGFLLIPAAWPGGAAVTMEAQSRREAGVGRGRAGQCGAGEAVGEPGGWALDWGGPADPGRGPRQALWSSLLLHPARPGLLDIKALCQRMRSRSQPCPLGRASRSNRGGSGFDASHPVGSLRRGAKLWKAAKHGQSASTPGC